ncbi:MAG: ABC transporter permease [Firmicutes bacterium]|nr:ABC transporter permease [Bacillota bacterium]
MVKKVLANCYLYVILALMYLPIMVVIVFSFSNSTLFRFPNGFTLGAYQSIFTSPNTPALMSALKNTFLIAIIASVVATLLGTISAIGIFNLKRRVRRVVESVNQMPIINSEIVMAVSLMVFFALPFLSFMNGYVKLIIAHITFCTPYVILSVMPRLMQMDPNIYEAALDLGASQTKALFKVIIPMLVPGIISGFVMAFTLSIDDFIITQLNKTEGIQTLSTYLYEDARIKSLSPFWFAVFSIMFVVVLFILLSINFYNAKKLGNEPKNKVKHTVRNPSGR